MVELTEGELWPSGRVQRERRRTPVLLVKGRVTPSSFRNDRRLRWVTIPLSRRLSAGCVQDADYAEQFRQLGAPPDRVADRAPDDTTLAGLVRDGICLVR